MLMQWGVSAPSTTKTISEKINVSLIVHFAKRSQINRGTNLMKYPPVKIGAPDNSERSSDVCLMNAPFAGRSFQFSRASAPGCPQHSHRSLGPNERHRQVVGIAALYRLELPAEPL